MSSFLWLYNWFCTWLWFIPLTLVYSFSLHSWGLSGKSRFHDFWTYFPALLKGQLDPPGSLSLRASLGHSFVPSGSICHYFYQPDPLHSCGLSQSSVMSNSLWHHGLQTSRLFCLSDSPARILEWVAIPFSRGSSWHRDQTAVSCFKGRFFSLSHQLSLPKSLGYCKYCSFHITLVYPES